MRSPTTGNRSYIPFDREYGLGKGLDRVHQSLVINIPGVYALLSLPAQLRNLDKGLYQAKVDRQELIHLIGAGTINYSTTPPVVQKWNFSRDIDMSAVISDNFDVDPMWTPYEYSSWVLDLMENLTVNAPGYIPMVGPLISVSFSVGLTAITDPDFFKSDNVLGLTTNILNAVLASALGMKENLAPGFAGKRMAVTV